MESKELMQIVNTMRFASRGTGKTLSMMEDAKRYARQGHTVVIIGANEPFVNKLVDMWCWQFVVPESRTNKKIGPAHFRTIDQFLAQAEAGFAYPPSFKFFIDPEVWVMLLKRQIRADKKEERSKGVKIELNMNDYLANRIVYSTEATDMEGNFTFKLPQMVARDFIMQLREFAPKKEEPQSPAIARLEAIGKINDEFIRVAKLFGWSFEQSPKDEQLPHRLLDLRNEFIFAGFSKSEALELVKALLAHG